MLFLTFLHKDVLVFCEGGFQQPVLCLSVAMIETAYL